MSSYIPIVTSRFNDDTWLQNNNYKKKINHSGCLYGSPMRISCKIPIDEILFVIEMNNSRNEILGIGIIHNFIETDKKYYKVYDIGNYNRYIYKGKHRLDRSYLQENHPKLIEIFDHILFKEKTHMKRGSGLTMISTKLLKHPICNKLDVLQELKNIFRNV
jgi:hypothetical protein